MENLKTTHNDNRKYARLSEALPVRVRFSDRLDSVWQNAQTANIGEGGLFVALSLRLESIGEVVHLDLQLDKDGLPLRLICQVAWMKREGAQVSGMGLKIIQIDQQAKEKYITYIYQRIKPSQKPCQIKFLKEPLYKLPDKERNCFQILDYIRRSGAVSKADISKEINLNAVSVGKFIDEFLKMRIILDCGFGASSGGRPAQLFKLNKDFGLILGLEVNLEAGFICGLINNMDCETIMEDKVSISAQDSLRQALFKFIKELMVKLAQRASQVIAIGIGFDAALTDAALTDAALSDYIAKSFNLPVIIEEGFHLESFAQVWLTRELANKNILYLHSKSLMSLILGGDIYKPEREIEGRIQLAPIDLEEKALILIELLGPDMVYVAKRAERDNPQLRQMLSEKLKQARIKEAQSIKVLAANIDEQKVVALGAVSLAMKEIFAGICA
jgi:Tfp pilus assembly protein PilZ/predicted NBD/HSP70 family sugar kinase